MEWQKKGSAAVRLQLRSVKISGYYVGISKTGGNQTAPYSQRRDIYTDYRRKGQICCDIMAERDGEIIKMITRSGLPRKKVGDLCKKGEILVSGILELKDDSQEVVKYEAVHADADIYIKRQKAYYHEIPMIYETYEWTGKKKKGIYLKAGRFYLEIADRTKNGWYQIAEEQKMYLTKSFQLPCSIGYITQNQYRKIKKEYTREEVKKTCMAYFARG